MANAALNTAVQDNTGALAAEMLESQRRRDEELIARVRSGDTTAFDDLVRPYLRAVEKVVVSIVQNQYDAQDVVQEALICAFTRLYQLRSSRLFRSWLFKIAVNHARMKLRSPWRKRYGDSLDSFRHDGDERSDLLKLELADSRHSPCIQVESREIRERIERALGKLPPLCRDVFVLREIRQLSMAQTAATLSISSGMVKTHLFRARKRLQRILAPVFGPRLRSAASRSEPGFV